MTFLLKMIAVIGIIFLTYLVGMNDGFNFGTRATLEFNPLCRQK